MTLGKFRIGLEILSKYYDDPDGYKLAADHDVIWLYPTDNPVSEADFSRLMELGWFQEDVKRQEDDSRIYYPESGWAAYV